MDFDLDKHRAYINSFHSSIQEVNRLPMAIKKLLSMDANLLNSGISERQIWAGYVKWITKWSFIIAQFCYIEDYETARLAQDIIDAETNDLIYSLKTAKLYRKNGPAEHLTENLITDILTSAWINAYETIYEKQF